MDVECDLTPRSAAMSKLQRDVLKVFGQFLMTPGQMLCLYGPSLEKHRQGLHQLTEMGFLSKEEFKGAYSLTDAGFTAMRNYRRMRRERTANAK